MLDSDQRGLSGTVLGSSTRKDRSSCTLSALAQLTWYFVVAE
jgi:hypothetical protein